MPDISMCRNRACPSRDRCYRFTATPSEGQSYSTFSVDGSKWCAHFMPVRLRLAVVK